MKIPISNGSGINHFNKYFYNNKIPAKVTKALFFERNQKQKKSENHTRFIKKRLPTDMNRVKCH
jgi:hypothetical protein